MDERRNMMKTRRSGLLILLALSSSAVAQHDPGRNAVRLLALDKTDAAIELVEKNQQHKMNSPIDDAERCFVLSMAACQRDDAAAAFNYAQQAVDNGLSIERLHAGPREILEPLYAHNEFKEWIKTRQKQLLHGPLLGSVTDASARFWVRTADETDVQIMVQAVSKNGPTSDPFIGNARTSSAADHTATILISGLRPNTEYRYNVRVNSEETGPTFGFRTFPKQATPSRFSIAFGGGAGFTPQYERMWTTIDKRDVSALLLLGDNVYIDDPVHPLTQRYCYYRRQSRPEWKQLVASTSVYSIYDDHDFGINDCIPGPDIEIPKWKREVWNIFTQNWNNPAYGGGRKQPGCWYDFHIGDVHFIMLDGRYYRDLKGGSMLGAAQKAWLFESLKSSAGKFKVLASPVPWSPGVKRSKDTWDGFPEEREEIFSFIETHHIGGVLLMAADRHRTDLRKIERANGYDLYEVMSSRLTNVHTHGLMENAKGSEFIMGYNSKCSFGLIEFDTTVADPLITYRIVNIDDELIDSRSLKLSQLQHNQKMVPGRTR
ncbi:MAG: alkaline phosphatase D [Candidatus Promineifilaceae bacterium]